MLQEIMAGHVVELFWPGTGRIAPEERAALKDFYTHPLVGVHELMGIFGEHNTTLSRAQFLADDSLDGPLDTGNATCLVRRKLEQ